MLIKTKILAVALVLSLSLSVHIVTAEAPEKVNLRETKVGDLLIVDETPPDIHELVDFYADKWGVSRETMHAVVKCESGYNPMAVGDGGKSHGLVQIYQPAWGKEITVEQSRNPRFALNFLGEKLANGEGNLWTCYRNLS